jgi:hypothetical protein
MKFASEYFRSRESKTYNFASFMKQMVFNLIKDTHWRPDWKIVEAREHMKDTVNKVLDVIYLNKRIQFLEEAISMLFEPHQLSCIHLLHSFSPQQTEDQFKNHRFRDRLVFFLSKYWS